MLPDEGRRGLAAGGEVGPAGIVPIFPLQERGGGGLAADNVGVGLAISGEPGVEGGGGLHGAHRPDGAGKEPAKGGQKLVLAELGAVGGVEGDGQRQGVDAGVGAARTFGLDRSVVEAAQRLLEFLLDGVAVRLALPALVAAAVICQLQQPVASQIDLPCGGAPSGIRPSAIRHFC